MDKTAGRKNVSPQTNQHSPLSTKITPPRLGEVLERPRLFELLDNSNEKKAVWISGPGGSGKTTLAAGFLSSRKLPCLWYQVDNGDVDLASFFHNMGFAVKRAAPRKRKPLPMLTPEYLMAVPAFIRLYFGTLFQRFEPPFVFVFDNYQDVTANGPLQETMRSLLPLIPSGFTFMFISREPPGPAMTRALANGQMAHLTWNDIRLTETESKEFIALYSREDYSDEDIASLHAAAGGWAAGLVLMLEQGGMEGSALKIGNDSSLDDIFAYFAGEVFGRLETPVKNFLLMTAFLPYMTPKTARSISGVSRAGHILSQFYRNHLFTEKRFYKGVTYQYHPLFRQFLQLTAKEKYTKEVLTNLLINAASTLEKMNETDEAFKLYHEAEDTEAVVRLVLTQAPVMMGQGKLQTLSNWLSAIPDELLMSNPWLVYWKGVCGQMHDPKTAEMLFENAFDEFKRMDDAAGLYLSWCGFVDCRINARSSYAELDDFIKRYEWLQSEFPAFPSPEIESRVTACAFVVLSFRQPHHPRFHILEKKVRMFISGAAHVPQKMMIGSLLARHYIVTGEYAKAEWVFTTLKPFIAAGRGKAAPLDRIILLEVEAIVQWADTNYEKSLELVEKAFELSNDSGIHLWDSQVAVVGCYNALSTRDMKGAERFIGIVGAMMKESSAFDVGGYQSLIAWKALLEEDIPKALEHASITRELTEQAGLPFAEAVGTGLYAQALVQAGQNEEAQIFIEKGLRLSRQYGYTPYEFVFLRLKAQIAFEKKDESTGLKYLREFISLGKQKQIWTLDFCPTRSLTRLYLKALENKIEVDYVRSLIQRQRLNIHPPDIISDLWPYPVEIATLGGFAIAVNGKKVRFSGKAQKKPLEMLKTLIALGGRDVPRARLSDQMWPESDGDKARQSFAVTLFRLRKLLGSEETLTLKENRLSLSRQHCRVDTWTFEHLIAQGDNNPEEDNFKPEKLLRYEKAARLYTGSFLENDGDFPWAMAYQESLRNKFIHCILHLAKAYKKSGEIDKTVTWLKYGLEKEELAKEFYYDLISCLIRTNRNSDAEAIFRQCKSVYNARLGHLPDKEIMDFFH